MLLLLYVDKLDTLMTFVFDILTNYYTPFPFPPPACELPGADELVWTQVIGDDILAHILSGRSGRR